MSGVPAATVLERCLTACAALGIVTHCPSEVLARWLERGRQGEQSNIVSLACPAYAYTRSSAGVLRYSYNGLEEGIGLAGQRFFPSLDAFHTLLRGELAVAHFQHEVLVADFEGFTEATLRRIGVTAAEFRQKSQRTAAAYQALGGKRIRAETFSQLSGGRTHWLRELKEMTQRVDAGEFATLADGERLRSIGEERRANFEQFFQQSIGPVDVLRRLITMRAIELATVGKLIAAAYANALVLSIGDGQCAAFLALAADLPVLDMSGGEFDS